MYHIMGHEKDLSYLMSSTKLTSGDKQVDVVAANEILGHVNNGSCDTCFTVMIFGNTSHVVSQLSDLQKESAPMDNESMYTLFLP